MKREIDYLEQAKSMISGGDAQLAIPYALIAIAESLHAVSSENLTAATLAGAEAGAGAAAEAMSALLGIVSTGSTPTENR